MLLAAPPAKHTPALWCGHSRNAAAATSSDDQACLRVLVVGVRSHHQTQPVVRPPVLQLLVVLLAVRQAVAVAVRLVAVRE